jgi:hypothetical protein
MQRRQSETRVSNSAAQFLINRNQFSMLVHHDSVDNDLHIDKYCSAPTTITVRGTSFEDTLGQSN